MQGGWIAETWMYCLSGMVCLRNTRVSALLRGKCRRNRLRRFDLALPVVDTHATLLFVEQYYFRNSLAMIARMKTPIIAISSATPCRLRQSAKPANDFRHPTRHVPAKRSARQSHQSFSHRSTFGPVTAISAEHAATTDRPMDRFVTCATPPIITGPSISPK
ncbi:hypothetical protein P3T23_000862 [Paraburkholderia sp. GAS448]